MLDVSRALLCRHPFLPELRYPAEKLVLRCGFNVGAKEVFKFMPDKLNGVQVWALWGRLPPVDSTPIHEVLCETACVLRVVVLLEAMTIRKSRLDEGQKGLFQDFVDVKRRIHVPRED